MCKLFVIVTWPRTLHVCFIPTTTYVISYTSHLWLVHITDADETRLSCLVGARGVNWIDKSRLSATENFETVLSSLQMRCELSLVLSWPSFQVFATWLPIVTSYLATGSRLVHKCIHTADETGQNCSVSSILRTTENCLRLSPTQFTPPTPTRQDSLVLSVSAVWTGQY